ncbi:MAG TPA: ABC transporter ATP-binding protein [Stellaceae bacterium]|nr:ABC transporter ATP-binding protein [Stellaceae bacterium]
MTALTVAGLSLRLGDFSLDDVSFTLPANDVMVVLGPNGAGKSVLLETIAGFHRPARGRVAIGSRDVTALPPEQRRVGFVVQNFGLFPHLSVAQNVALGARGHRRAETRVERVDVPALLERFGIAHLGNASPIVLSPGEKQRAALARAEASHPDLFLLDEPFAALDAPARSQLRLELARFLRARRLPALFVTHDYVDVAALGDQLALMRGGRIIQCGAVDEVFRRPVSRAAADILGFDNQLAGRVEGGEGRLTRVAVAGGMLRATASNATPATDAVYVAIRAEDVRLARPDMPPKDTADNRLAGTVVALEPLGALTKVALDCGFSLVACVMSRDVSDLGLTPGTAIAATIAAADVHVVVP